MAKAKNDDNQDFLDTIYQKYRRWILCRIQKSIGYSDACNDVFQDVFEKLIKKVYILQDMPTYKLEHYMNLVIHGVCVDYLRKKNSVSTVPVIDEAIFALTLKNETDVDSSLDETNRAEIYLMLESLDYEDRLILVGAYCIGLSSEELAAIIGGTAGSVRTRLHRIKKHILKQWKEAGLQLGDFFNE